jgi:hypothetical protein
MRLIAITPAQGKRIARTVKRSENGYTLNQRQGRIDNWNPGVLRGKVTTPIPTGTFDSPSDTGMVQIYAKDQVSGSWLPSGDPQKVFNQYAFSASVATGTACMVAWISGEFWLIQADCPS